MCSLCTYNSTKPITTTQTKLGRSEGVKTSAPRRQHVPLGTRVWGNLQNLCQNPSKININLSPPPLLVLRSANGSEVVSVNLGKAKIQSIEQVSTICLALFCWIFVPMVLLYILETHCTGILNFAFRCQSVQVAATRAEIYIMRVFALNLLRIAPLLKSDGQIERTRPTLCSTISS